MQAQQCHECGEEDCKQYTMLMAYVAADDGDQALATGGPHAATCDSHSCPAYKIIFEKTQAC
jgi:hypothetical protein